MIEYVLAILAYGAIVATIVLYTRSRVTGCGQDCDQGRDCHCDDEWNFK